MEPRCEIRIEGFQGPLDLLLHLINKNSIDIKDIPIALVTNQYLAYLELLRQLDVSVAAEYLVMAATLMQIKSRMLLPRPEPVTGEEDPRIEIVRPLQELKRLKELADQLSHRPILGRDIFVRTGPSCLNPDKEMEGEHETEIEADLMELIKAFERIVGNQNISRAIEIARARTTVAERAEEIRQALLAQDRLSFWDLLNGTNERDYVIVTFLALLELAKQKALRLFQAETGGEIFLFRTGNLSTGEQQAATM